MKQKKLKPNNEGIQRRRKKRIANEILLSIGRCVLLVLAVVAVMSIFMVRLVIMSSQQDELTLESKAASYQLADFFDQYTRTVETLAVNLEILEVMEDTKQGQDLTEHSKYPAVMENLIRIQQTDSDNIMAVWICDINPSKITQSDGYVSGDDFDAAQRAWYECVKQGKTVLTPPYVDISTGMQILTAAAPAYDANGQVVGVIGADISLSHVNEMLKKYKIGNTGSVILTAQDGTIIYHTDETQIQQDIHTADVSDNVLSALDSGTDVFLEYTVKGTTKFGYLGKVSDTGYSVLSNLPEREYYSLLLQMVLALAVIFILGMLLIAFSIRQTASKLTKPIQELNKTAQKLAEGNLDVTMCITAEDEIGELGDSISKTVDRLKTYIAYINEVTQVLGRIADGKLKVDLQYDYTGEFSRVKEALLHISSSMNTIMEGINDSADKVAVGSDELARASQSLAEGACLQAAAVEELVATSMTVTEQVEESRKEAQLSAAESEKMASMMEQSREQMNRMQNAMNQINETSNQVVSIINTIEEIAGQTNLLALNASIEAARAGEAGRGFAVVADEIGKLSDESSKAAGASRELIGVSIEEIRKGNVLSKDVVSSLTNVAEAVEKIRDMIQKNAEQSVIQAQSMEQIRSGIEEISKGIQENSAMSEESSATSEQLSSQASVLNDMVKRFELI